MIGMPSGLLMFRHLVRTEWRQTADRLSESAAATAAIPGHDAHAAGLLRSAGLSADAADGLRLSDAAANAVPADAGERSSANHSANS